MENKLEKSARAIRGDMGLISWPEVEEIVEGQKALTQEEKENRANDALTFYRSYFGELLKIWTQAQLVRIAEQVGTPEDLHFCRGAMGVLSDIRQWFERQEQIVLEKGKGEEPVEPEAIKPVGEFKT